MVLYKRKPVPALPLMKAPPRDAEVWVMHYSNEIFAQYEDYLARLEYYQKRNFTCEITGHTNLTFFEAWESETHGQRQVENTFPNPLREPVLRKVQFSQTSRIDDLVNELFETFKEDFFPGERVTCHRVDDQEKVEGIIRDKASFQEIRNPTTGAVEREATSRYFITISKDPPREALMDNKHIFRSRKLFTKQALRSFLKKTIYRERWEGAVWMVKEEYAKQYHIDTTLPPQFQQEARIAERKAQLAFKKGKYDALNIKLSNRPNGSVHSANHNHQGAILPHLSSRDQPLRALPPAPVKYPIDDLEIAPAGSGRHRPNLKFLSQSIQPTAAQPTTGERGIRMESVGILLEVWNTLNVMTEILYLDSFTFDDFLDAMMFDAEDLECELLAEVHCAVLSILVDEDGKSTILTDIPDSSNDENDADKSLVGSSTSSTPEHESLVPKVHLSSRTAQANGNSTSSHGCTSHRAVEMLAGRNWADRVQKRDYRNGGWQVIMVGLLHQMSLKSTRRDLCLNILSNLAPLDEKPTRVTAKQQYLKLDVNLRIAALQLITMLAMGTDSLKEYILNCARTMTDHRNLKQELQRKKKPLVEQLHALKLEEKIKRPESEAESPEVSVNHSSDNTHHDGDSSTQGQHSDDEESQTGETKRRVSDRMLKRKRVEDEILEEKKKQAKLESANATKNSSQYKKLLKEIVKKESEIQECEDAIAEEDEGLRENEIHRTKLLGRDRFWNRYWWFERNGMPFSGLPNSSTASRGYANGRIWVQGPGEAERKGFIELPDAEMALYRSLLGITIHERKASEEGPTSLNNAYEWGFYDDPSSLEQLIEWLDDRGHREKALKKELKAWKETMVECMEAMNGFHQAIADKKANGEDPAPGIATRKKAQADQNLLRYPCLAWTNSIMRRLYGHTHAEGLPQPEPEVPPSKKSFGRPKGFTAINEKPVTRQGTRYA